MYHITPVTDIMQQQQVIMMMIMLMMIMSRSGGSSGPPSRVVSVTSSQVRASLRSQEAAVYTTQLSTTSNTSTLSGNSNTSSNRSGNRRTVPRLETQDSFDSWSIPVLSKEDASRILSSKRPRVRIDTFSERSLGIIFVYYQCWLLRRRADVEGGDIRVSYKTATSGVRHRELQARAGVPVQTQIEAWVQQLRRDGLIDEQVFWN